MSKFHYLWHYLCVMMDDILQTFKQLNLKPHEIRVYLACLQGKSGVFAHEITKQTRIKRTTVDLILKRLIERGFVTRFKSGARYMFLAEEPEKILFRQEQLTENLKGIMPLLARLSAQGSESEVRFFEGVQGVRDMYDDMFLTLRMSESKEILDISSGFHLTKIVPDADKFIIGRRIKLGLPIRIIAPETSRKESGWVDDPRTQRAVRYFNAKQFPFNIAFDIYADKVSMYSPTPPITGIILRNAKIAGSLRSIYEMLWLYLSTKSV